MYKELVRRNVLTLVVSLVIFFFISLSVISFVSNRNLMEDLVGLTTVLSNHLDDCNDEQQMQATVDEFAMGQDWFSICIYDSLGQIVLDSDHSQEVEGVEAFLSDYELKMSSRLEGFDTYLYDGKVCCMFNMGNGLICKTFVETESNVEFFLIGTLFLIATLACVVAVNINRVGKTSANVVDAFNSVTKNLRLTAMGEYQPINTNHEYPEVEQAFTEINGVNNSIYQYITKLSTERDKLNYIVENVSEGLMIIDVQGGIYAINDYARNIFGVDVVEKHTHYKQIVTNQFCRDKIDEALQSKQKSVFDYHDEVLDKIYFTSTNCFKNSQGENIDLISVVMYDVTWLRREQRNRADFIANASHELKTPITSISGFSELISSGLITDQSMVQEYVGRIHAEAVYMKKTVDDLLYLSKLDYSEGNFTDVVSVLPLLQQCVKNHDLIASQKQVVVAVSGDDAQVLGNESLLKHMLSNLIDNAIKYNKPNGKVVVNVVSNADDVLVTIGDQGQGIPPQHLSKMFDRFYRIDNSRSRETGGTGLGLSIVHKVCSLHDAKISVESKEGQGTTFTIRFTKLPNN